MRNCIRISMLCTLVIASLSVRGWAQTSGRTFVWTGDAGSDVTNGANWIEQPDPDTGAVPGPQDYVELRWGDRAPVALDYSSDATYERLLFNHANHPDFPGIGTTINGTGTLTLTKSAGPTSVDVKSIESQGGHRVSTINANINALGMIEARNGHDLIFNGNTKLTTVHAYMDDDGVTTSDVVFNGPVTHTGYNEAKFMTGTGTVRFNNEVTLDHTAGNSGFGIRNGMTMILGQNFSPIRFLPGGGGGLGLDTVDIYNGSKVKLEGDFVVGPDTDLFSRAAGGQNNTNTLNLNGHSDAVEFLGTHLEATFVIDFGVTNGANSFMWETTHHLVGNYNFVNFEIGVDTLTLGNQGTTWWTALDTETDGGGSPDTEVDKSRMTINGIPYHAFNASVTTPYWSLVNPEDPTSSRNVQFFNVPAGPAGDFNGNGKVDAADYVVWRNTDGSPAGYNAWRSNFGSGSGAGSASSNGGAVPEPVSIVLIAVGVVGLGVVRRPRRAPSL